MSTSFSTVAAALEAIDVHVLNRCKGVLATLESYDNRRRFANKEIACQLRKLELLLTAGDLDDDPVTWTSLSNALVARSFKDWKVAELCTQHGVLFDTFRKSFKSLCEKQKKIEENEAENIVRKANGEVPEVIMTDGESVASTSTLGSVVSKMKRLNLARGNDVCSVGSETDMKLKILHKISNIISNRNSIENVDVDEMNKTIKRLTQIQSMEFAHPDQQTRFYCRLNEEILIEQELSLKLARETRRARMTRIEEDEDEDDELVN
ncbi:hypothetical protein ACHAXS_010613 [Conticribra weissflogii]